MSMSQGENARKKWENSLIYPPDGDKWYQKSWFIYLVYGALLLLFIILMPVIQREMTGPHPERPEASPNEWMER